MISEANARIAKLQSEIDSKGRVACGPLVRRAHRDRHALEAQLQSEL